MIQELAKYVPQLEARKWVTRVCSGGDGQFQPNGGLDNQERFKEFVAMLTRAAHHWRNPRVYHLCLTGGTVKQYSAVLTEFKRSAERKDVKVEYKTAIELDSSKQLHLHCFLVMSTGDKRPSSYITASKEEGVIKPSLLRQAVRLAQVDCPSLALWVCRPQSKSKVTAYIQLNQTNNEYLNEACTWGSYLYKKRSKGTSGPRYGSSRRAKPAATEADSSPSD